MHKKKNSLKLVHIIFSIFLVTIFSSCSKKDNRIVIWTSSSEFAPYIELFNSQHKTKAVLVYKDNTANALPPANDELKPDIVLGSYLRNSKTKNCRIKTTKQKNILILLIIYLIDKLFQQMIFILP